MSTAAKRSYRSPLRETQAGQTRLVVVEAARKLFEERGWAATSMRDIAREAQVSIETLYSNFGGKAQLLKVVSDVAVVGDDEPLPLADRPLFQALGQGSLAERADAAGHLLATLHARTALLRRAVQHAAPGNAELTELLDKSMADQRRSVEMGITAVARRTPTVAEVDVMFAVLSTDVYLLLVERSGWDGRRYRLWAADTIVRLLTLREDSDK